MIINNLFKSLERSLLDGQKPPIGKGVENDFIPGDIEIIDITVTSEDGQRQYSLLSQCKTIEIYESITSPVIFCDLGIADSIGLLETFALLGEEYVSLSFKTFKDGEPVQFLFRLNSIDNVVDNETNKMKTYTLRLVSPELLHNSERFVSFSYEDTISNIVTRILSEEISTQKPYFVDKTVGIEKGVVTRLEPFKACDYFRRRAVSSEYSSSSFCFFEGRRGYVFTTLEKLMHDGQKAHASQGVTDKEFFFDVSRNENIGDAVFRNIIAFNRTTFADSVDKVRAGGINNVVSAIDILTGDFTVKNYTSNVGLDKFKFIDGENSSSLNTSGFALNHGKHTAVQMFMPFTSDKPLTDLQEKLTLSQAYAQIISQNICNIHVYGDSELQIGDVIKCSFPSSISADNAGQSRLDSGNYLISKIRHIIINSDRPQHTMALELIKGNLTEAG